MSNHMPILFRTPSGLTRSPPVTPPLRFSSSCLDPIKDAPTNPNPLLPPLMIPFKDAQLLLFVRSAYDGAAITAAWLVKCGNICCLPYWWLQQILMLVCSVIVQVLSFNWQHNCYSLLRQQLQQQWLIDDDDRLCKVKRHLGRLGKLVFIYFLKVIQFLLKK